MAAPVNDRGAEPGAVWSQVASAAGALGAFVGVVYVGGSGVLSLRYVGFGLSGQRVAGLVSHEYAFFAGARALLIWGLLGASVVYLVERAIARRARRLGRTTVAGAGAAILLGQILLLHVWWPVTATGGLLVLGAAQFYLRPRPLVRFVVAIAVFAVVAVVYEADRVLFGVDRVYVELAPSSVVGPTTPIATAPHDPFGCVQQRQRRCGLFVLHNNVGLYLAVASSDDHEHLVFVPERSIESFSIDKVRARLPTASSRARRKPLRLRIWDAFRSGHFP